MKLPKLRSIFGFLNPLRPLRSLRQRFALSASGSISGAILVLAGVIAFEEEVKFAKVEAVRWIYSFWGKPPKQSEKSQERTRYHEAAHAIIILEHAEKTNIKLGDVTVEPEYLGGGGLRTAMLNLMAKIL